MLASLKENIAKRKARRAEATARFHARIAEINEKRDIELALIAIEQEANKEKFRETMAKETAILKEAWAK